MKAVRITLERPPRFTRYERDRDFFRVGQKLRGRVWVEGPGRPKAAEVRWIDARGRLCGVAAGKLDRDRRSFAFEFDLDHSVVPGNHVECSIDGVAQPLREPFVISPPHEPWLDLHTFTWARYPIGELYDKLQGVGIDATISYKMTAYEAILESGFKCYVDQACPDEISTYHRPYLQYWEAPEGEPQKIAGQGGFPQRWRVLCAAYKRARVKAAPTDVAQHVHFRKLLWREHCPNNPGVRRIAFERFNEVVKMKMGIRPMFINMADEPGIGDQAAPFDFCYCNHCMEKFRQRMEGRYGTLARLNAAWGTGFATWEEVYPLSTEQTVQQARRGGAGGMGRQNFASWNDHRAFMDDSFTEFFDDMRRDARQFWQFGLYSHGGDQAPNVFGGWDYAKIVRGADVLIPYNIAGNDEVIRSLAPDLPKCSPYFGDDPLLCRQLWHGALNWDLGFIFWDNNEERGRFFDHRTGRPTQRAKLFGPVLREIKAGVTRLTRVWRRQDSPVGVLYSQPSMRAHWMVEVVESGEDWIDRTSGSENTKPRHHAIRTSWMKLIEDCQVSWRFVSYLDVQEHRDDLSAYKVLVLPEAASLSDAEAAAVREFVAGGGTLIADGRCGIMDGHLIERGCGVLDDVFGVRQSTRLTHRAGRVARRGEQPFADLRAGTLGAKAADAKLTLAARGGAVAYADAGGTPAVICNSYGRGRAILLNLDITDYRWQRYDPKARSVAALQAVVREALAVAGVSPAVQVTDENTGSATGVVVHRYGVANAEWIALLNNVSRRETGIGEAKGATVETWNEPRTLKLDFDLPAHTYLPRAGGRYLGQVTSVTADLPPLEPLVVARLAYKVSSVKVACEARHAAGAALRGSVTLTTTAAPAAHVVRLDVYAPDGTWCHWYSKNLVTDAGGSAAFEIPFALNDPRGRWRLAVRDVVTGLTAEKPVTLTRPAEA